MHTVRRSLHLEVVGARFPATSYASGLRSIPGYPRTLFGPGCVSRLWCALAAKSCSVSSPGFVLCHDHECCPCATPRRRHSDRRSARRQTLAGARVQRSAHRPDSGKRPSDSRPHANVIPGPRFGWCLRSAGFCSCVPCFDAASDHSGGWPAKGRAASPRNEASPRNMEGRVPTRPGFDRGGKGSNPARRDHLEPTCGGCR